MFVICLVEKHIFAIAAVGRPLFKDAFVADTVFLTQALPEHGAHYYWRVRRAY